VKLIAYHDLLILGLILFLFSTAKIANKFAPRNSEANFRAAISLAGRFVGGRDGDALAKK
jgi:hypothetical protein